MIKNQILSASVTRDPTEVRTPNDGPISKLFYHRRSVENVAIGTLYADATGITFTVKASVDSNLRESRSCAAGLLHLTSNAPNASGSHLLNTDSES